MQPMTPRLPPSQPPDPTLIAAQTVREKYRTFRTGIRVLGGVFIAYFGFHALQAMAGQNTSISIALSLIFTAVSKLEYVFAFGLMVLLAGWALAERLLRYRKVKYLQGRIKNLEIGIDPERSSSNLTIEGKTNPQDRG